ncbi:MAG: 1-deoxy-D-xylulose-5-phosphate reductoisomerase [Chloroflexi bacterium]|nr:MAG: 1-deoxy-D-xylulose-5-phosphate reductoisomerase [Chloroflexota bacterium]
MSGDPPRRQGVVVLGSTGSIGANTLDVIAAFPERFNVVALAAGRNRELLDRQIAKFRPQYVALRDGNGYSTTCCNVDGPNALVTLATLPDADIVVIATTGHAAIAPTLAALEAGKIVALANKESIVAAGALVMEAARRHPGNLRPVDSEHSAIWQCLGTVGERPSGLRRIILTASGGPFRGKTRQELAQVSANEALKHPTWVMGAKITIDSATLMNKGLELIEAAWLFDMPADAIDVVVHPQSIVHSLVEYDDGSVLAQLGPHDMRLPIQYALTWPQRIAGPANRLDFSQLGSLEFLTIDSDTFPAVQIAREALRHGSTFPTVYSTADEVAVEAYLAGSIGFLDICDVVTATLDAHQPHRETLTLDAIDAADTWARRYAHSTVQTIARNR